MFLIMRCSGYAWASRIRARSLSSSCRMCGLLKWCCIEVLVNKFYLLYSWMGEGGSEVVSCSWLVFYRVLFYLSGFRKIDLLVFRLLMFISYLTCALRTITQVTYFESSHNYWGCNSTHQNHCGCYCTLLD